MINFFPQYLINAIKYLIPKRKGKGYFPKIILGFLFLLRKIVLLFSDPLIQSKIGKYILQFPLSHYLPIDYTEDPTQFQNLANIASIANSYFKNFSLIDIGANIGDSFAVVRTESFFPILCIEGDRKYFSLLESNVGMIEEAVTVHALVGENDTTADVKLTDNYGGSKNLSFSPNAQTQVSTLTTLLEQHSFFWDSKMLKIDVDGYDCKILRGAKKYLQDTKPIIFFEYSPRYFTLHNDDGFSIFRFLEDLGYFSLLIYEGHGDLLCSTNFAEMRLLEELHYYFSGSGTNRHADICVFHREDSELYHKTRDFELQYYARKRRFSLL
ncbi:MAG: FkbM family methyltransferase [Bacteroidota bacterium]|nr:FkbM family methyltransferase [Bacteroidota bacterium]